MSEIVGEKVLHNSTRIFFNVSMIVRVAGENLVHLNTSPHPINDKSSYFELIESMSVSF